MSCGFTLIELLVVVLIIGILAAVALPQYQKAVERSRATQALSLLKSISKAAEAYYLTHGKEFISFDELDINIPPWTGTKSVIGGHEVKSNDQWSLESESSTGWRILWLHRNSGKYKGAGFGIVLHNKNTNKHSNISIFCTERINRFDPALPPGAYCEQVMKAKYSGTADHRFYSME